MKRLLLFTIITLSFWHSIYAYDFSAISPSGHTLYYNILSDGLVELTYNYDPPYGSYGYYYPLLTGSLVIPDSVSYDGQIFVVSSIGNFALNSQTELLSISIPNTVTFIGENSFTGCTGLTDIMIPGSVTFIGPGAFMDCEGLTSITIPRSVTSIGIRAFDECYSLSTLNYNADSIDSFSTQYQCHPFSGCPISIVNIGNNVKVIPSDFCSPFRGYVESVTIGDSVTSIGSSAFIGCRRINSITIPNAVSNIGQNAFEDCSGLTSLVISSSVIDIGSGAFSGCSGLANLIIGNSVINIGSRAFYGCGQLTSVIIPNSVTNIGDYAFYDCDRLTKTTIGTGVLTIGNYAFKSDELYSITSKPMNPPTIQSSTFRTGAYVLVPCGAGPAYNSTAYWRNIHETLQLEFSVTSNDSSRGFVSIVTAPSCNNREAQVQANAYHGYHFDHWSDGNTDNPRYIVVLQDTHLVAYFASDNGEDEGIEETAEEGVKLYQRNGQIVVEGAEGNPVYLYDVVGRLLATKREAAQEMLLDVPASGAYLVKIGDTPARRIVVRR